MDESTEGSLDRPRGLLDFLVTMVELNDLWFQRITRRGNRLVEVLISLSHQ